MSKLTVIYNKEYDTRRVLNTLKKMDWYVEHGYDKSLSFPKTLDRAKLKGYSEEEIRAAVEAEYSDGLYKENEKFLSDSWAEVFGEMALAFAKSNLSHQDEYKIFLTRYGTGGSYDLPNVVIINLSKTSGVGVLKTIIHEIIHLAIQGYIDERGVSQWQKERIVDLFFVKNFPRMALIQNVYASMDTKMVDQVFDDTFPDMRGVIEKLPK